MDLDRTIVPRPMTPERAKVIGDQAKSEREFNLGWRERTLLTFSDCTHVQRQLVEVENEHGVWGLEICVNCGQPVLGPQCPHVHSTWNEEGTVLTCDNCGIDGT